MAEVGIAERTGEEGEGKRVAVGRLAVPDEVGHVAVYAMDHGPAQEEMISVTIPRGWLPPDPESGEAELLGEPYFNSATSFSVALPNGETRTFQLTDIGHNV